MKKIVFSVCVLLVFVVADNHKDCNEIIKLILLSDKVEQKIEELDDGYRKSFKQWQLKVISKALEQKKDKVDECVKRKY